VVGLNPDKPVTDQQPLSAISMPGQSTEEKGDRPDIPFVENPYLPPGFEKKYGGE
jgi:hypothetical protein